MIHVGPSIYGAGRPRLRGDQLLRRTTFHFGLLVPPARQEDLVVRHNDTAVFVDERIGVVFPMSRMTVDGDGRQVADTHHTEPHEDHSWLI